MKKIKELIIKNYKWIIFFLFFVIFLVIAEDVFEQEIFEFDSVVYNFLVNNRNEVLNNFFKIITQFGSAIVLIIITILCVIFIRDKKYKILVPANLVTIAIINIVLKNFFLRPRPDELRLIEETGYSFPSGHAMASTAFYGLLIYIVHEKVENKILRNTICIMLGLLILLISISRIYVGVHYTSDVIAGTCFSIAYLILITRLIKSQND